jgi:hypothetical protein
VIRAWVRALVLRRRARELAAWASSSRCRPAGALAPGQTSPGRCALAVGPSTATSFAYVERQRELLAHNLRAGELAVMREAGG